MFDFSSELLSRLELYTNINYRSHISKTYHCNILETIIWNDQKISLQWPHIGIMPSQITGCLTLYSGQLQIQQNFALFYFYCAGNPLFNSGFPSQRASNVESIFMAWHCHVFQWLTKSIKIYIAQKVDTTLDVIDIQWGLLHWGLNKVVDILQMTFPNAISWMVMFVSWLKFQLSLFLRVQITKSYHWFRQWLGTKKMPSHYLNQYWPRFMML